MSNIIEPDTDFIPKVNSILEPQIDWAHGSVILGRDRQSTKKLGLKDTLHLGVICEQQVAGASLFGYKVLFDNKFPHIIFICGKRGSGKSYTLGVIVEELGRSNSGIGTIVIDPLGTFWTMKNRNQSEKVAETLAKYGLYPRDFDNIEVLTPTGFYEEMKDSVDGAFSVAISDLSVDDWCMVFDIDRFKTQGLLIGDILDKINNGYYAKVGNFTKKIPGKTHEYTIGDILFCIQNDVTINSPDEGYASGTRRSVIARFRAAAKWGIFSVEGTPLNKISIRNKITILDVSHSKLGSSRRALLVGILARKILEARIEASRMEEATEMGINIKGKENIPVTWLIIDEAHLLLPSSGKTPASESLVEYAKLGRKPGCGLVLATQRPAATNDDILSQVDTIFGHNLALEDDIAALRRRIPAKIPHEFNNSDFIRSMPVGICLLAEQKTQQRTMLVQVRPRMTHHSGKAAVPKSDEERELEKPIDTTVSSGSEHEGDIDFEIESTATDEIELETIPAQMDIMGTTIDIFDSPKEHTLISRLEPVDKAEEFDLSTEDFPDIKQTNKEITGRKRVMGVGEEKAETKLINKIDLNWGGAYIIASKDPEFGFNILNTFSKSQPGQYLSITRTHPKKINVEILPKNLNQIWLSTSSEKDSISPGNITKLAHIIYEFLKENENSVIFLDGVEYLINNNNFPRILKFIELIHEKIVLKNGILLVPINPSALAKNNLALLENELANKIVDPALDLLIDEPNDEIPPMDEIPQLKPDKIIDRKEDTGTKETLKPKEEQKTTGQVQTEQRVRSASKEDLVRLCDKLGLDTTGSVEDLKKRLLDFEEKGEPFSEKIEAEQDRPIKTRTGLSKSSEGRDIQITQITEKERAMLSAISEERKILESLLSERKRLELDIKKLRDAESKQKMQLERQKILDEREKLKREKRELEDERKKLEKRLRLTIKQVAAAQMPEGKPKVNNIVEVPKIKEHPVPPLAQKSDDLIDGISKPGKSFETPVNVKISKSRHMSKKVKKKELLVQKKKTDMEILPKNLIFKPMLDLDSIEEFAIKQLKTSILGKPLEVIKEITPLYLPLLRIYIKSMRGSIFAKEYSGTIYWDTVTGEIITDITNVPRRSKGLAMLMTLTSNQAKVLSVLDTWGYNDVVDLENETNIPAAQLKRTLTNLEKRSMVLAERQGEKRLQSYKRLVELKIPDKLDKIKLDLPEIEKGILKYDKLQSQFKLEDLKNLLLTLKPGTRVISKEEIYYPYFKIDITGKHGPRTVILDSITGTHDKVLTDFLIVNGLME